MNDCQDAEIARLKAEAVRAWDNARQREQERDQLRATIADLTEALEAALDVLVGYTCQRCEVTYQGLARPIERVRAALARAKGNK